MNTWHGFKRLMMVSAASLAVAAPGSVQALDWFLKIDGIKGESTDALHKDEIVIEAFSWGAQRTSSAASAMRTRPCFSELSFVKLADAATPLLLANTFSGMSIPKAVLVARKAGEGQKDFLTIELSNVLVSSVSHSGTTESISEAFSLQFTKARVSYRRQDDKGGLLPAIETTLTGQTC